MPLHTAGSGRSGESSAGPSISFHNTASRSISRIPPWLQAADTTRPFNPNDPRGEYPLLGGRFSRWSSFNSANRNIRNASTLAETSANTLTEINLLLSTARRLTEAAVETGNLQDQQRIQSEIDNILVRIDAINATGIQSMNLSIHGARAETDAIAAASSRGIAPAEDLPDDADIEWPEQLRGHVYFILYSIGMLNYILDEYNELRSSLGANPSDDPNDIDPDTMNHIGRLALLMQETTEAMNNAFQEFVEMAEAWISANPNDPFSPDYGTIAHNRTMFNYFITSFVRYPAIWDDDFLGEITRGTDQAVRGYAVLDPPYPGAPLLPPPVGAPNMREALDGLNIALFGGTRPDGGMLDGGSHGQQDNMDGLGGLTGIILRVLSYAGGSFGSDPSPPIGGIVPTPPDIPDVPDWLRPGPGPNPEHPERPTRPPLPPTSQPPDPPGGIRPPAELEPPQRDAASSIYFHVGINRGDGWWMEIVSVSSSTLALRDALGNSAINVVNADPIQASDNLRRLDNAIAFVLGERATLEAYRSRLNADSFRVNEQQSQLDLIRPEIAALDRENFDPDMYERRRVVMLLQWLSENAARSSPANNREDPMPPIPGFVRPAEPPGQQ